jgi:NAD(P)-dependent dehydrogenase (short-subunit alcohol dehydrogenase family)
MRTALVTGASSGIGAAACKRLGQEGWDVIGLARRPSPEAGRSVCADITRFDEVARALDPLPPLRLLIHCAATIRPITPLASSDPDAWRLATEVNLLGTYNVLRLALAGQLAVPGTAIHLTTGAASPSNAKPYWSAYNASKAGAEHLARSAASEVQGTGRAVCSLDPGITETAMQQELRATDFPGRARFVQSYEEGTSRTADEVAEAISELSQRDPSTLNGRTFRVGAL